MTAFENAILAPKRIKNLSKIQLTSEVEMLFERFDLAERMHNYPDQLSGGQQQRVAIRSSFSNET
jgi:polar amino acid transport system ATP-binding protein